jgi:hypothetical protein
MVDGQHDTFRDLVDRRWADFGAVPLEAPEEENP